MVVSYLPEMRLPEMRQPPTQQYVPPTYYQPTVVVGGEVCPCVNDFKCDWWKYLLGAGIGVIAGYIYFKRDTKEKARG